MSTTRFFYFYDTTGEHRRPMVTVCRLRNDAGEHGYGWAICSNRDLPCKRTGRAIAEGRARAALKHKRWGEARLMGEEEAWLFCSEINRPSALHMLKQCGVLALQLLSRPSRFSTSYFFDILPKSMQPYDWSIKQKGQGL